VQLILQKRFSVNVIQNEEIHIKKKANKCIQKERHSCVIHNKIIIAADMWKMRQNC